MKVRVKRLEVHIQEVEVEAEDFTAARKMVNDGEGEEIGKPIYDYTLDSDDLRDGWQCYEVGNDSNTG